MLREKIISKKAGGHVCALNTSPVVGGILEGVAQLEEAIDLDPLSSESSNLSSLAKIVSTTGGWRNWQTRLT